MERKLERIEKMVTGRRAVGTTTISDTPIIYSRVLMATLNAIRDYEKEHGHGVFTKVLARIRDVETPTIYDHLSKLEAENLVVWYRGSEIGLKPHNGKFYSIANREEFLSDLPVLMSLPDRVIPIAQTILKSGNKGCTLDELVEVARRLRDQENEHWKGLSDGAIVEEVEEAVKYLLRRILVRKERTKENVKFYALEPE